MGINKNMVAKIIKDLPKDPALRLVAWNDIKEILSDFKKLETALRKEMLKEYFPKPKEGTSNVALGHEWKVRCKQTVNRKLDESQFENVFAKLPRGSKQKLIKFDPKLVVAEYNKLSDTDRAIFDEALTEKNGAASLELVPPKELEL